MSSSGQYVRNSRPIYLRYAMEIPGTRDSVRVTADALDALGHSEEAAALRERYGLEATRH